MHVEVEVARRHAVPTDPKWALEHVSHYATEPAAKKLEKTRPDVVARLWCAQGMRVVNAKKSKYYGTALSNFERAWCCFEKAGLTAECQRVVEKLRSDHHDGLHGRLRRDRRGLRTEQEAVVPEPREGAVGHATMRDGSKAASLGQPARGE
jgi:hypothetical protein